MLNRLLAGALFARALARNLSPAAPEAPQASRTPDEQLRRYSNQVLEANTHISNAAACYNDYVDKIEFADFAGEELLNTIDDCNKEYAISISRLHEVRGTARDLLFLLRSPGFDIDHTFLVDNWMEDLVKRLDQLGEAAKLAVRTQYGQNEVGEPKPWKYPDEMKCYDQDSVREDCLGTKAFCDKQGANSERCFQSRKRPQFQVGLEANCKDDTSRSSEACVGTEEWCSKRLIVQKWGSRKTCVDYRERDAAQQQHPWEQGSGCSEKTEACLGTFSWCALYYRGTYSSQAACFGDRKPWPKDGKKEPWKFPNASLPVDSEIRKGTEALCIEIKDTDMRNNCYSARERAPWRFPFSPDCPVEEDLEDERCMGSQAWCEYQKGIYGSLEKCLSARQQAPGHSGLSWQYGEGCADRSEKCLGTFKACSLFENAKLKQDCIAARSTNSTSTGGFEWCANHWSEWGYKDEHECYTKQGFDALGFENSIISVVAPAVESKILEAAYDVIARALFRELAVSRQPRDSALKSAKGDLTRYLDKVRTDLIEGGRVEQAVERALSLP